MKKEYQTPKMEIVEMSALGNLLQASFPGEMDALVEDGPEEDGGGD